MTFNEYTDTWYSKLANYAKHRRKGAAVLRDWINSHPFPSRKNLFKLNCIIWDFFDFNDEELQKSLQIHVKQIWNRGFKDEFRCHFNKRKNNCSATSELFSMVRQSIAR